jgi:hypothetical protein
MLTALTILIYAGVFMIALAPPAAAAGTVDPSLNILVTWAPTMFIVGLILMCVAGLLYWLETLELLMIALAVIGGLLMILAVAGFIIPYMSGDNNDQKCPSGYHFSNGSCVPDEVVGPLLHWSVKIAAPYQAAVHDQNTEYPDSPFTACSAISPAGTATLGSTANWYVDNTTRTITYRVTVATSTAAGTSAAYYVPDCVDMDFHVYLDTPQPAVGGGLQEVPYWIQVNPSRTSGTYNNGTMSDIWYEDTTNGLYLGTGKDADSGSATHTTDHVYSSYLNNGNAVHNPGQYPTVGDWVMQGTADGNANGEWSSVWWTLKTPGGLLDYTDQNGRGVTLTVYIGTMPGSGYNGNIVQWTINVVGVKA